MRFLGVLSTMVVVGVLFTTPAVRGDYYAGKMSFTRIHNYYTGNGGEFTMAGPLDTSAYADVAKNVVPNGFQTFCVELGEYVANPVDTWVSTKSIDELTGTLGADGSGSHAFRGGKDYGDNLDSRTAYLYTQFATGLLSNYEYSPGTGRQLSAGELQRAFWHIEEDLPLAVLGQAQAWVDEAQYQIDSGLWSGIGDVRILNNYAYNDNTRLKQDQLYLSRAVPLPAAALLGLPLLGMFSLLRLVRRRSG